MTRTVLAQDITKFVALCQAAQDARWTKDYPADTSPHMAKYKPVIEVEMGRKYAKISKRDGGSARSVFGFVDMVTVLVYKAASFKKVETNFPRGNVHEIIA